MLRALVMVCLVLPVFPARAELTAFEEALSKASHLSTRESIVEIAGKKYRKVEYQNNIYYLQLLQLDSSQSDLSVLCGDSMAQRRNSNSQPLVSGSVRVTRRTRFFVEGLHQVCSGEKGRMRLDLIPDIQIGFMLEDSKDPGAVFRDRRITINPFTAAVGFGASW